MKINNILNENDKTGNTVSPMGQFSFLIDLVAGQRFSIKSVVTGKASYINILTRSGDQLIFDYNFGNDNTVMEYEVRLRNTEDGTESLKEDGEFNLNDAQDVSILKKDVFLKMDMFKDLLTPQGMQTVERIYKNIIEKIDSTS